MNVYEIIKKKRDGYELDKEALKYLVNGYVKGEIPDYQMSAFLMAVFFRGMTNVETHDFTMAMADSGVKLNLISLPGIKVDKHSSGGVADTVTLVVGPIAAAAGVTVAKMSGRGLGHTGGTIDKLESIPGFRTDLNMQEFMNILAKTHIAVVGQTEELVPADKKIYALRDVTATVDSIPLIAASIMSKKLASGADAIVLDVKTGSGAFMKDPEQAKKLAMLMVAIGKHAGKKMLAYVTDMNQPLGTAIGNALEIKEAMEVLKGRGPKRLQSLCIKIAAGMLLLGEKVRTLQEGESMALDIILSGSGLAKFNEFIISQGGNQLVSEDYNLLPHADYSEILYAERQGFLQAIGTEALGMIAVKLGAGRQTKDDLVDYGAGLLISKELGDKVEVGEILCRVFASDEKKIKDVIHDLRDVFTISDNPAYIPPLIYDILT